MLLPREEQVMAGPTPCLNVKDAVLMSAALQLSVWCPGAAQKPVGLPNISAVPEACTAEWLSRFLERQAEEF